LSVNNVDRVISSSRDDELAYDANAKRILADKTIIAKILKNVVDEFRGYDEETIKNCIEGEPEIGNRPVDDGMTNAFLEKERFINGQGKQKPNSIIGRNVESKIPDEGVRFFDVVFNVVTPIEKNRIKLIINLEAQKNPTEYDLETRGVFYCARLLSSQLETEFTGDDYDSIKKVYSIWICMDSPKYDQKTIARYKLTKEDFYGKVSNHRYDLLEVIMIRLGDFDEEEQNEIIALFETIFTDKLDAIQKKEKLENDFDIEMTDKFGKEVGNMCNLSQVFIEKGINQGIVVGREEERLDGMRSLIESLHECGISEADIVSKLVDKYDLTLEEATSKVKEVIHQ